MRRGIYLWVSLLTVSALQVAALAGDQIQVETRLEKTAFFVGEPVRYQVRVQHPESVEFILERLQENNLRLDPFEIRRLSYSLSCRNGFRTLTLELELVTYEISQEQWQIPAFDLYLVRRDAPLDNLGESPVETLQIPAQPIAFRSALTGQSNQVRAFIETGSFDRNFWVSTVLGLLLLGLVVAPMAGRLFARRPPLAADIRMERSQMRQEIDNRLQSCNWDATDDGGISLVYDKLAQTLREYASWVAERNGNALSGRELRSVLSGREEDHLVDSICELVQLADRIRYSPGGLEEGRTRLNEVRNKALGLFGRS